LADSLHASPNVFSCCKASPFFSFSIIHLPDLASSKSNSKSLPYRSLNEKLQFFPLPPHPGSFQVQNAKFAAAIFLGHLIFKHAHTLDKKRKKKKKKSGPKEHGFPLSEEVGCALNTVGYRQFKVLCDKSSLRPWI
jgi:hypothetical protein